MNSVCERTNCLIKQVCQNIYNSALYIWEVPFANLGWVPRALSHSL